VYFEDFPKNVPDTHEFWLQCIVSAWEDAGARELLMATMPHGWVNLLDLPEYGRYLHTYEEMVARHEKFAPTGRECLTVIHIGGSLEDEAGVLYTTLATSPAPLNESDRALLSVLAGYCIELKQPDRIPMRESRAVINAVRVTRGVAPLWVDTVTDILRLSCALSDGDVTLATPSRFRSHPRATRRALLTALDDVVSQFPAKLADVSQHAEAWKRLAERLHPWEFALPNAQRVFAVAQNRERAPSIRAIVEEKLATGDVKGAADALVLAPGLFARSIDRLLRVAGDDDQEMIVGKFADVTPRLSGRVLVSLRDHLQNRGRARVRIFVNTKGSAKAREETRPALPAQAVMQVLRVLDDEIANRMPTSELLLSPVARSVALPLSAKSVGKGFRLLPRGSRAPVLTEHVRFFVYWRESSRRTDFDLSAIMLGPDFEFLGQVSYTNIAWGNGSAVHSGDVTAAPDGASEFIDIDLTRVPCAYLVPQVNIYAGEGFSEVAESFFGYMNRDEIQEGLPFEPATVEARSELRGPGRISLPMAFARTDSGWEARWMHLMLKGRRIANATENNRLTVSSLAQAVLDHSYFTIGDLVDIWHARGLRVASHPQSSGLPTGPVTFIGIDPVEGLPDGSRSFTLANLSEVIPEAAP
jgi:stress response protein SCP2